MPLIPLMVIRGDGKGDGYTDIFILNIGSRYGPPTAGMSNWYILWEQKKNSEEDTKNRRERKIKKKEIAPTGKESR